MNTILLRCLSCGTKNRVRTDRLAHKPACGKCRAPLSMPGHPVDATASSFQEEVVNWPGAVLAVFWSPSCGHCMRLNPVLDQLAEENQGKLKIVKVNVQSEQHLAFQFGVRGVPFLTLYHNGRRIADLPGAVPKDRLVSWIDAHLGN